MLNGTLSAIGSLDGLLAPVGSLSGTIADVQYSVYEGEYTFQPTTEPQEVETANKALLDNITVQPIPSNYGDVSGVTATAGDVKSGKQIVNSSRNTVLGTYVWDWKGDNAEFLGEVYSTHLTLADTTFSSWTPSTTAKAIKAAVNAYTFTADLENYEYLLRWRCKFTAAYNDGATLKVQVNEEVAEIWQAICRRPNSLLNIQSGIFAGNVCNTLQTVPLNVYYNSGGVLTYTYSISYGIYPSATAATFSSSTSNNPVVTVKSPAYNARCSTTYFSTARASELDLDNSTIDMVCELYRMPISATQRSLYEGLIDLYNNSIINN